MIAAARALAPSVFGTRTTLDSAANVLMSLSTRCDLRKRVQRVEAPLRHCDSVKQPSAEHPLMRLTVALPYEVRLPC